MTFKEYLEYLENNLANYELFLIKAEEFQKEKNKKRPPAKRWNENKINKSVSEMWSQSMEIGFNNINSEIKQKGIDAYQTWISFIEKHEVLEAMDESISELEFE